MPQQPDMFSCITYHDFGDARNQYTCDIHRFREQLDFLRSAAYTTDGFDGFEVRLRSTRIPSSYVLVTIDDGLESTLTAADLLQEHGFAATIFVTRDRSIRKPGYIAECQIRDLRARGFCIGTHGTTHRKLTKLPHEECARELSDSKHWLEGVLSEPVHYMAAPGGFINSRVKHLACDLGYRLIGNCSEWTNSADQVLASREINRVNIRRNFTPDTLRQIVSGNLPFYLQRQVRSAALWIPKRLMPA